MTKILDDKKYSTHTIRGEVRALHDNVLAVIDFGEIKLASGIIILDDDGIDAGIHPRWATVVVIGPKQLDVAVGDRIYVEHGRWSRRINLEIDGKIQKIHRIDTDAILAVAVAVE